MAVCSSDQDGRRGPGVGRSKGGRAGGWAFKADMHLDEVVFVSKVVLRDRLIRGTSPFAVHHELVLILSGSKLYRRRHLSCVTLHAESCSAWLIAHGSEATHESDGAPAMGLSVASC